MPGKKDMRSGEGGSSVGLGFPHKPEHLGGSLSHLPVAPLQWSTTVSVLPGHDMLTEISGAALVVFFSESGASMSGHPSTTKQFNLALPP